MAMSLVPHWTNLALSVTTIATLATSWLDQTLEFVKNQALGLVYNQSVSWFNVAP